MNLSPSKFMKYRSLNDVEMWNPKAALFQATRPTQTSKQNRKKKKIYKCL